MSLGEQEVVATFNRSKAKGGVTVFNKLFGLSKPEANHEESFEELEARIVTLAKLGIQASDLAVYRILCKARGVEPKV